MVLTGFQFGAYHKRASIIKGQVGKVACLVFGQGHNRIPPFLRGRQVLESSTLLIVVAQIH